MKVKTYRVLEECVERGIQGGMMKAEKYSDKPTEEEYKTQILHYVMLEICEYFDFDEFREDDNSSK